MRLAPKQAFFGLAYFEFTPSVTEPSGRVVEDAVNLAHAGYRIETAELSEKMGYGVTAAAINV